jgi:6-pyruvoyltetrahydropterin/6-carboxytetrahydropterin synthase
MISVTRRFTFSAGHRLTFHKAGCKNIHGHNYIVDVTLYRKDGSLDEHFMVIDFHVMSETIGKWLDDNWDHSLILSSMDDKVLGALGPELRVFQMTGEPTAENMASMLFHSVIPKLLADNKEVRVSQVDIWENEKSKVTVNG